MESFGSAEASAPATDTQSASSDEGDSPDSTPGSPTCALTPVADQLNRWCVDGQYQVYSDAKIQNDKVVMIRALTLERQVLKRILPTMPNIHTLFTRHRLEWIAHVVGRYCEEMVRDFYASYVVTLRSQRYRRVSPAKQTPLEHVRVRRI